MTSGRQLSIDVAAKAAVLLLDQPKRVFLLRETVLPRNLFAASEAGGSQLVGFDGRASVVEARTRSATAEVLPN